MKLFFSPRPNAVVFRRLRKRIPPWDDSVLQELTNFTFIMKKLNIIEVFWTQAKAFRKHLPNGKKLHKISWKTTAMVHFLVKMDAYISNITKMDAIVSVSSEFYNFLKAVVLSTVCGRLFLRLFV